MTNFRITSILVAAVVLLSAPSSAGAIVPPTDCHNITVKGHRYNIKADQLRCTTAKRYSTSYLRGGHRPSGYTCQKPRGSKIAFRCWRGIKTFFAIRR